MYFFAPRYLDSPGRISERRPDLDRGTTKSVVLRLITANGERGTRFDEIRRDLPAALSRDQIQTLLKELKEEGTILVEGATRGSKWYPRSDKTQSNANESGEG